MNGIDVSYSLLEDGLQIIPLTFQKKPKVKFKDVAITERFIEDNYEAYGTSTAFGILCRGVWCIDIDVNHDEHKSGFDSLQEIEEVWQDVLRNAEKTYVQTTPRKGRHLVFKKRNGIRYTQHINYLDGVDVKAQYNNFFVMAGSVTDKGVYTSNNNEIQLYDGVYIDYLNGTFEDRIFSSGGTYDQQTIKKYQPRKQYSTQTFRSGGGGLGKQAYQRIIEGVSSDRNNDLFLAVSYAKACDVTIEPLTVLIGTNKNGDIFTESEFWNTVKSAGN